MRHTLRRQCEKRLRGYGLQAAASVEELVELVGQRRGRVIALHPLDLPAGGPTGAWVATSRQDHVYFERRTSRRHQTQIIAHELGHMLCEHHASPLALITPLVIRPGVISLVLGRESYEHREEQEAEQTADLLVDLLDQAVVHWPTDALAATLQAHRPRWS